MVNHQKETSSLRYERKFFITNHDRQTVERMILNHGSFFSEVYSERFINNIYFDCVEFQNYMDNVEGSTHRKKFRIRWYGNLFKYVESPVLEVKIKNGNVGFKEQYTLRGFEFSKGIDSQKMKQIIRKSDINKRVKIKIEQQLPILVNRYRRKYFVSGNKKYRITVDDKQSFFKFNTVNNTFMNKFIDPDSVILEIKYDKMSDSTVDKITSQFPFRVTKSSKYARGISTLYM